MSRYEILFLSVPEITADETSKFRSDIEKVLNENHASLISFDRWGKYLLAYPIRKNDYGVYFLVRFDVDNAHKDAVIAALTMLFAVKNVDLVMRHMVARLDEAGSLEYQRPESLEEAPSRDSSDSFFKGRGFKGKSAAAVDTFSAHEDIEELEA